MTVSFEKDIKPTLSRSLYRDAMAWRLDLAKYEDVKLNADIIYGQITQGPMPPPPYDPFPQEFITTFKAWKDGGLLP
jgi:hypothetical protein